MQKEVTQVVDRLKIVGTDSVGMNHSGELLTLRGFEFPEDGDQSERRAWFVVNSLLAAHESFPQNSRTTSYVQERLNVIAGGEKATVVVIHDDEPNALALPGYVVVTDGILKIIDNQEELDGLLAHEWVHVEGEHSGDRSDSGTPFGEVGRSRAHETEADLRAMEILDSRGINVRGTMQLFEKMEKGIPKKESKSKFKMGDITHGSLLDRRLNLEELLWLMDVRHVSDVFTPVGLGQEDLDQYQKDKDVLSNYDALNPLAKSHFIQRQFRKITFPELYSERSLLRATQLVELQRNLLQETAPDLSVNEIDNLLAVSVVNMFPVRIELGKEPYVEYPDGITREDLFKPLNSKEEVVDVCSTVENPVLKKLGISVHGLERAKLIEESLTSFVLSRDVLDMTEYTELINEIKPLVDIDVSAAPILIYLNERNEYGTQTGREINDFLAESAISSREIESYVTGSSSKKIPAVEEKRLFVRAIEEKRIERATKIKDPVEFFKYVGKYRDEVVGEEWATWRRRLDTQHTVQPVRSKAQEVLKKISINQMLSKLKNYASKHELKPEDNAWLNLIAQLYSPKGYYTHFDIGDPDSILEDVEMIRDSKGGRQRELWTQISQGTMAARCMLWAIGMDKSKFMEQVASDLNILGARLKDKHLVGDFVDAVISAPYMAQEMGFPVNWEVTPEDLNKIGPLSDLILKYALGPYRGILTGFSARDENTSELVDMLENFSPGNVSKGRFSEEEYKNMVRKWNFLLERKLSKGELTDQDRLELFALGCIVDNVQVNLQVPGTAMEQLVRNKSFDEAMELIFDRFSHLPQHLFSQAIEHLVEYKARTPEEFAQLEEALKTRIEDFLHNDELIGKVALADGLLIENYALVEPRVRKMGVQRDTIKGMEPVRLLKALLTTSIDDSEFKKYLFERWWLRYRTDRGAMDEDTDIRGHFQIEDIAVWRPAGKEARLNYWASEVPARGTYKTMSELQSDTYLASTAMKYYALRKILTGENGVLSDQEGREGLINAFLEGWVDFEDSSGGENIMRELLTSLFTVADKEELYQRINPILMDLVLRIPEHAYSYEQLAREFAKQELERMGRDGHVRNPNQRDEDFLAHKIHLLMTGGQKDEDTIDTGNSVTKLLELFSDSRKPADDRRLSPIELAVMVGEKSGAVGVRALQLAGQYFDVPEAERERFLGVYDSMKGQTRIQAYRTLKREAQFSPEVASLMDEVAEFKPRIGGGSLMTVYEVVLKDGRKEAIAVKNPNVEYHVGKVIDSLRRTMEYAREHNPDNKEYQLFEVLLSDVQEWIINELVDPRFEEKDIQFRLQNDTRHGQFDPGRNRYGIHVPESTPTGTRWVRREEFIDGNNLTALVPTDEATDILDGKINREDHKQAISLLVRNYIYQLTETGLVHSDIHPGNFRITADNASIAVFDRYNMLELNDAEQGLIRSLIPQIATGGVKAALTHTVNYLFEHENNANLQGLKSEVMEEVAQNGVNGSLERSIMDAVVMLKQRGVHVPLNISLIAKNLFALNSLAKDAGFQGITDAYTATADPSEIMKLITMGRN